MRRSTHPLGFPRSSRLPGVPSHTGTVLVLALAAASACDLPVRGQTRILYETGFEAFEGFKADQDLIGQGGWVGFAGDLAGKATDPGGNGVLAQPLPGFNGQYAYIGYTAPDTTADFSLWKPVQFKPTSTPLPLVRFQVAFQIEDSTEAAPFFDSFRWSVYSLTEHRFLSLDFDNETLSVNYILDDAKGQTPPPIVPTGFSFEPGQAYDLEIDLNLQRNQWTARINGQAILTSLPITSVGEALTVGDIDPAWVILTPGKPGDNFIVFDDYRVSAIPLTEIPPRLEPVGLLHTGAFVLRILGEPGVTYALEAARLQGSGAVTWEPIGVGVAQSPNGTLDLQDSAAAQFPDRVYRAVSRP
ncbi:MAG: hypothetical protein FJ379_03650 [Verrucomicrobia bacterium]|nr:hypothetical protein [Verrucomicrobiota bacterium]